MTTRSRILTRGGAALAVLLAGSAAYTIPHVHNDLTQEALRHLAVELGAAETYQGQPHHKDEVLDTLEPYGITNLTVSGHTATVHGSPRTPEEIAELRAAAVRWGVADLKYEVDPDAVASGAQVSLANGVVTLRGTVASEAQRRVLVSAAQGVYGAANVVDRLTIDAGGSTGGASPRRALTDAQVGALGTLITSAGKATALDGWVSPSALRFRARVATSAEKSAADAAATAASAAGLAVDSQIVADATAVQTATVSLTNGVVTLRGTVASEAQRRALVSAAQGVYGASNVVDQLVVSAPAGGAGAQNDAQVNALASMITAAGKASSLEGSVSPGSLRFRARVAAGAKAAADGAATRAGSVAGLAVDSAITTAAPATTTTAAPAPTTTAAPAPTTTAAPTLDQQVDLLQKELDALAAIQLQSVFFASGSAELTPEANAVLVKVAEALAKYPLPVVEVGGHTDSDGDDEANRVLSEQRAGAVRQALLGLGVAPQRLSAVGFGETAPRADNATADGRARNRRVEFVVKKG